MLCHEFQKSSNLFFITGDSFIFRSQNFMILFFLFRINFEDLKNFCMILLISHPSRNICSKPSENFLLQSMATSNCSKRYFFWLIDTKMPFLHQFPSYFIILLHWKHRWLVYWCHACTIDHVIGKKVGARRMKTGQVRLRGLIPGRPDE